MTLVELDPGVTRLARTDHALSALNAHAYRDPRLTAVSGDAFSWLRAAHDRYDVVIADLPDPGISASTKLYSAEFYGLAAEALAPGGRLVVHAGPAVSRPRTYWTVEASMRAAGLHTSPYRISGRHAGFAVGPDRTRGRPAEARGWGFVLAGTAAAPAVGLDPGAPPLRSLTAPLLRDAGRQAEAGRLRGLAPSTLVHPRYWGEQ